jgi:hypothetical protein
MLNEIMEVLTERRMMSVGNLAGHLELEAVELQPLLEQLEADGRIRYAFSRCKGSCSTCASGCGDDPAGAVAQAVDETAIVISLELRSDE